MKSIIIDAQMLQKFDTEENWINNNPILKNGQLGYVKDNYGSAKYKIGDGTTPWNELEWAKNYFIGTKAEYIAANDAGLIRPGMVICITDDNDYCNIPIDNEMSETSEHVVLNKTITNYVNTHDLKNNACSSIPPTFDGGVPFAGAKSVTGSLGDFISKNRSGFYTMVLNNTWYNVISNRHRNGSDDGNSYGLVFLSELTSNTANLIWDRQSKSGGWQGQRTILDSTNSINYFSKGVKDTHNSNNITLSYGKAGMNYNEYTWLAGWNGYELRAIQKNQFMAEVYANNYWGMAPNGDTSLWVRTTSQGIIPYQGGGRGGGHQYLGTDSWYFANSYIDHMYAVNLNLSSNIESSLTTSTHIAGAKGTAIINSTASGSGYNMLAKLNSNNGIFNIGYYQSALKLYYISNTKINANQNGFDKEVTLLNESGNSSFPGTVSANSFSAGGSSSFTTATISNLTVNGSMRLKNSGNYGMKLNFGDGDYVYLHEDINDNLTIRASKLHLIGPITYDTGFHYYKLNTAIRIGQSNSDSTIDKLIIQSYSKTKIGVQFYFDKQGGTSYFCISNSENHLSLGAPNLQWGQVYSINSTISTSDKYEKKEISYIGQKCNYNSTYMSDETLIKFIRGLQPAIFKRINGESNRPHHGFIAQDIEQLLKNLNIYDHAGFIKSPKSINLKDNINGEYIRGLRYEEFISDHIRFSQIIYDKVQELKEENRLLEEKLSSLEEKVNLLLAS